MWCSQELWWSLSKVCNLILCCLAEDLQKPGVERLAHLTPFWEPIKRTKKLKKELANFWSPVVWTSPDPRSCQYLLSPHRSYKRTHCVQLLPQLLVVYTWQPRETHKSLRYKLNVNKLVSASSYLSKNLLVGQMQTTELCGQEVTQRWDQSTHGGVLIHIHSQVQHDAFGWSQLGLMPMVVASRCLHNIKCHFS